MTINRVKTANNGPRISHEVRGTNMAALEASAKALSAAYFSVDVDNERLELVDVTAWPHIIGSDDQIITYKGEVTWRLNDIVEDDEDKDDNIPPNPGMGLFASRGYDTDDGLPDLEPPVDAPNPGGRVLVGRFAPQGRQTASERFELRVREAMSEEDDDIDPDDDGLSD